MQENNPALDKERLLPPRNLKDAGVALCALQDLSADRAAALGVILDDETGADGLPSMERLQLVRG